MKTIELLQVGDKRFCLPWMRRVRCLCIVSQGCAAEICLQWRAYGIKCRDIGAEEKAEEKGSNIEIEGKIKDVARAIDAWLTHIGVISISRINNDGSYHWEYPDESNAIQTPQEQKTDGLECHGQKYEIPLDSPLIARKGGAVFIFNYETAHKTQFNPQRYFCHSILKTLCPKNKNCPSQVQGACYQLRTTPIDSSNWEALDSFTRLGNHFVNPASTKVERDFITSDNTTTLEFTPYVVAVWSDLYLSFDYIHNSLVQNRTDGYVGCTILDILKTPEDYHSMCNMVDCGWDALIKDRKYVYLQCSDHPLKADIMAEMGFLPAKDGQGSMEQR